jgi:hypothetical protein
MDDLRFSGLTLMLIAVDIDTGEKERLLQMIMVRSWKRSS